MSKPLRLYTFALSHFSEKIRWLLDASGTPYREEMLTPFLHLPRTLLLSGGRGTTVPVIEADGVRIQDSARILQWLAARQAPFALLPEEPGMRSSILEIEKRFGRVGTHIIRFTYSYALDEGIVVPRLWTLESGPLTAALVQRSFPLMRAVAKRAFAITPPNAEKSRHVIEESLDWLDAQLADSRKYLVGSSLTAADICACALLAPLACPDQHPVYSREDYRAMVRPQIEAWSTRPSLAWVRELYRRERNFAAARIGETGREM